jgi:hypothetical protein
MTPRNSFWLLLTQLGIEEDMAREDHIGKEAI